MLLRALFKCSLKADKHLSRKPVPVFDDLIGKEMLPAVKSEYPPVQLWTIPTCSIIDSQWEELSTSLSTSPPQEAVKSNQVAPQPPFLQTRQTQSSQLLLTGCSMCYGERKVMKEYGEGKITTTKYSSKTLKLDLKVRLLFLNNTRTSNKRY